MPVYVEPIVHVSWDGSGLFSGPYDEVTNDVLATPGVSVQVGRDTARAFAPPMVPSCDFDLNNEDGRYSQERADSPVYQRVLTGRPIRVMVAYGERVTYGSHTPYRQHQSYRGRGYYPFTTAIIDQIDETTRIGDRRVRIAGLGEIGKLVNQKVSVPIITACRTDQAVTALLDALDWPLAERQISIGSTTFLHWWCDQRSPWEAMVEILVSEGPGAAMYVDPETYAFHFEGRNYRATAARSTTSQGTFYDGLAGIRTAYGDHVGYRATRLYRGRTSGLFFTNLEYRPGFKQIVNRATYQTRRRELGALGQVWQYGSSLTLTANQTRWIIARPSDPFLNAVAPALGVDYTVTSGIASVSLANTGGTSANIQVVAGAGGATIDGVTSTGIQLRAQPLTIISETQIETNPASSLAAELSVATFGEQTYAVPGWPEIDPAEAEAVCSSWVARYLEQRPTVSITLRNADEANLRQILDRRVSDRITIIEPHTGTEADFYVETKSTTLEGLGGRVVTCVLGCEPAVDTFGAAWDEALWDDGDAVWGI